MRIVLDTNVLVAGLLNPFGPPGRIVLMVAGGELTLAFDARILTEYREVLARPRFAFRGEEIDALLDQIASAGEAVIAAPLKERLPDPDDEAFLEVAVAAGVDYLVTGNSRHYPPSLCGGIRVVAPAEFLELFRAERQT